jgi:hypothetical protein
VLDKALKDKRLTRYGLEMLRAQGRRMAAQGHRACGHLRVPGHHGAE